MDYASTTKTAKRWGVSKTRVLILAKQGRIPGAQLAGGRWLIPVNAAKPADGRAKDTNRSSLEERRFPLYFTQNYLDPGFTDELSEEERHLYDAQMLFLSGEMKQANKVLNVLAGMTRDRVVRAGALYTLCMTCIYLKQYSDYLSIFKQMQGHYLRHTDDELVRLLALDLETFCLGSGAYVESFRPRLLSHYGTDVLPFLMIGSTFSALAVCASGGRVDPTPYEVFCNQLQENRCPFSAQAVYIYTAIIHCHQGDVDAASILVKQALEIAQESNSFIYAASCYPYMKDIYDVVLKNFSSAVKKIVIAQAHAYNTGLVGLIDRATHGTVLSKVSPSDHAYIGFAIRGLTNKEIASTLGLSQVTVSKRFAKIYQKVGVHGKQELAALFSSAFQHYDHT